MNEDILINWSPQETRVAVVENGALQELHVERTLERGLVGNVYLGKVARVLSMPITNAVRMLLSVCTSTSLPVRSVPNTW